MAKFKYKAIQHGTLSNPYRFVKKDEIVHSDEEIKCKWLLPVEKANAIKPLPIMPNLRIRGALPPHVGVVPVPPREAYDDQMKALKALEAAQDAKNSPAQDDAAALAAATNEGMPTPPAA